MRLTFPPLTDRWILREAPQNGVVVSSRARLARNLPAEPFSSRANAEKRLGIAQKISEAFARSPLLRDYHRYVVSDIPRHGRQFLRESHLISAELDKGGAGHLVYLNPEMNISVMINEEDHLRMSALGAGMCLRASYEQLAQVEHALGEELEVAYSDEFGFLTACPTNTGTGLRMSVMLHLPALSLAGQLENVFSQLGNYGVVVRGAYGEHSDHAGDLYQISNEITLGKSEDQILHMLEQLVSEIVGAEVNARGTLCSEASERIEDMIYRAIGILSGARRIDSSEAIKLLSQTRLGIGTIPELPWDHAQLSRLMLEVQPAHIEARASAPEPQPEQRDSLRAAMLRGIFEGRIPLPNWEN